MAKRPKPAAGVLPDVTDYLGAEPPYLGTTGQPTTTGRYIVTFRVDGKGAKALSNVAGMKNLVNAADFDKSEAAGAMIEQSADADGIVFDEFGIAVVSAESAAVSSLNTAAAEGEGDVLAVEPERYVYPAVVGAGGVAEPPPPYSTASGTGLDYVRGYRDATNSLAEALLGAGAPAAIPAGIAPGVLTTFVDTAALTWGLQATGAATSSWSGRGIRVAVLDTGFDLQHPDFVGRAVVAKSFIPGQPPQDGHGHGTHCIGTALGPQKPGIGRRYGIAYNGLIYAGKVLSNQGSGTDTQIISGIRWAIQNKCAVISMSLGADVPTPSVAYEQIGSIALQRGSLIIAAAGNNANRLATPPNFGFVGVPANSRSIMAVGALDPNLAVSYFSARSGTLPGARVDIAGPGRNVYSSVPMPVRYGFKSGTSMATPHVSGIAALFAEAKGVRGVALYHALVSSAQPLPAPSVDVGAGLVKAP